MSWQLNNLTSDYQNNHSQEELSRRKEHPIHPRQTVSFFQKYLHPAKIPPNLTQPPTSHLKGLSSQIFRARGDRKRKGHREAVKQGGAEETCQLDSIQVSSFLMEAAESKNKSWRSIFKPKMVGKRSDNGSIQRRKRRGTTKKPYSDKDGGTEDASVLTTRKSHSIMIIRKVQRLKDRMVQAGRDKPDEIFQRRREVPIHHAKYYFSQKNKAKAKTEFSHDHLAEGRTSKIITDFMKLREAYNQGSGTEVEHVVHPYHQLRGESLDSWKSRQAMATQQGLGRRFRAGMRGRLLQGSQRGEEGELGPWKRQLAGDFQEFFQ